MKESSLLLFPLICSKTQPHLIFLFFSISFFSFFLRIESWKETFVNDSNETPVIKIYFGTGERVPHVFKE
ncbi:hypothetical protein LEP1GSC137_2133 [Leptospira borgpetersenii str. Noumea 25]|nr:hypothetical protein LEP1GSC137_2133 [Leptospira borgpetersenii str. Noumea 25]